MAKIRKAAAVPTINIIISNFPKSILLGNHAIIPTGINEQKKICIDLFIPPSG